MNQIRPIEIGGNKSRAKNEVKIRLKFARWQKYDSNYSPVIKKLLHISIYHGCAYSFFSCTKVGKV